MKDKIAITTTSFAKYDATPLKLLKKRNLVVKINTSGRRLNKKETLKLCNGCIGIVAGTEEYDREVLQRLRSVKVISRCGVATENVDPDVAHKLRIKIYNTPETPTLAVAELTIGLILALLRKIALMDREMRANLWKKRMGSLLSKKQAGIIGLGRIGRKVAELLRALGADVFFADPNVTEKQAGGFTKIEFKQLLKSCDIISLHLSYSKRNYGLLGKKEFSLMKPGAFLINCSRGGVVDERALYLVLKEGKLSGAALDVFSQEPYSGPLKKLDQVILTPHIGSYAKEARIKMEIQAAKNLIKGLEGLVD